MAMHHTSPTADLPQAPSQKPWWMLTVIGGLVLLVAWSYQGAEVKPLLLIQEEGRQQLLGYLGDLYPPDLSWPTVRAALWGCIETLAISLMGTLLAFVIAISSLGLCSRATTSGVLFSMGRGATRWRAIWFGVYLVSRGVLNLLRAIPELIWALILILAVGLGPFAGMLALGIHTGGVLGKLYAETIEDLDPEPIEALQATGAGKTATFLYGMLPQAAPAFVSYGLYRWEVNIRAATILGFVGAGGIGKQLHISISLFHHHQLFTQLLAIFALVTLVDLASSYVRRRLI